MRTLDLLKALTERELAEFDELIGSEKRKSLQQLHACLKKYRKKTDLPGNEELFKKAFGKVYTTAQNYLLRNELRLLNDLIYDYLINATFHDYVKKHKSSYYQWLGRSFFDRKIKPAFEADIDRFISYAEESINPLDAALLLDLKSLWLIYNQEKNLENLQGQIEVTKNWKKQEIRRLIYRVGEAEARTAYLEHAVRNRIGGQGAVADWRTPSLESINLTENVSGDWFPGYLLLKKHSYQCSGPARIEVLKQMLVIEEDPCYEGEYSTFNAQISTLNNIAIEYILLGELKEGERYIELGIERCERNNHPIVSSNLQNYVALQMPLAQYQKGIEIYEKYQDLINSSRGANTVAIYRCYCYLFLGKPEEALSLLPENVHTRHDQLFSRMVYVIAFYLRGQTDLALNECRNTGKFVNAAEHANTEPGKPSTYDVTFHWIIKLFNSFIKAMEKEGTKRQTDMQKLKTMIWANKQQTEILLRTEFPLLWLWREVEKHTVLARAGN
jgi:hypothetical protein